MSQITKNKLIKALERLLDGDVTKLTSKELRNKARKGKLKSTIVMLKKKRGCLLAHSEDITTWF